MRWLLSAVGFAGLAWMVPTSAQAAACNADYVLAPDHSALSILFNDLTVEASGPSAVECTIDVPLDLPDGMKLYVLHAEDGSVLGFTDGYASAYGAAVQNELTPVSVH